MRTGKEAEEERTREEGRKDRGKVMLILGLRRKSARCVWNKFIYHSNQAN